MRSIERLLDVPDKGVVERGFVQGCSFVAMATEASLSTQRQCVACVLAFDGGTHHAVFTYSGPDRRVVCVADSAAASLVLTEAVGQFVVKELNNPFPIRYYLHPPDAVVDFDLKLIELSDIVVASSALDLYIRERIDWIADGFDRTGENVL